MTWFDTPIEHHSINEDKIKFLMLTLGVTRNTALHALLKNIGDLAQARLELEELE